MAAVSLGGSAAAPVTSGSTETRAQRDQRASPRIPGDEQQIVWSPDSRAIAFARRGGGSAEHLQAIHRRHGALHSSCWSRSWTPIPPAGHRDGRLLGFDAESPDTGWDQWILPLDGGEPYPVLQTQFSEVNGVFSPDGRWLAFASDDSGRSEIYVTPFPGPGRRWRVSTEGGFFANWSSTGREIFFMSFSSTI